MAGTYGDRCIGSCIGAAGIFCYDCFISERCQFYECKYAAGRIARTVFEDPEQEQIETVSRMIRYGAHLALFFVVGLVTAFVSMVIFRGYFRIVGILLSGAVCYMLAYYTEYFKQYVDGRHFQMTDVQLNWYGCLAGIFCMVGSYFLNRLLVKMST